MPPPVTWPAWPASSAPSRRTISVLQGRVWNSYAPADRITTPVLEQLPAHLRPARMRTGPGGSLEPDYHVHQALASVGLADAAAELPPKRRTPPQLTPTAITGGARIDRIYLTSCLVPALGRYEQAATGRSDHQALLLTLHTEKAAGGARQTSGVIGVEDAVSGCPGGWRLAAFGQRRRTWPVRARRGRSPCPCRR